MSNTFGLLVPCYNAAAFIPDFLKNVQEQHKQFDEIIFYDDASTDETVDLLRKSNYRVINAGVNMGQSFARNRLIEITECTWIHFHDIDDFMDPKFLQTTSSLATEDIDVVLCNVDWYDESGKNILMSWKYSNLINKNPIAYTISHPIGGINGLYKKNKLLEINGFNEAFRVWEDSDLHIQLAAKNAHFRVIEEVLSYSVRRVNSASTNQLYGWQTRLSFLNEYAKKFKSKECSRAIGDQAQITASNLIFYRSFNEAEDALKLSESCGVKVPNKKSFVWNFIKFLMPQAIRVKIRLLQLKNAFH